MLMADDMEKLKERTKEQIELQNELLRIKREELADNARKQYQEGEFFGIGNGIKEDVEKNKALHSSLYDSYKNNEESYTQAVLDGDSKRAKKFKKTMDEQSKQLDFYYKDNLELYQEYSKKELEVQQSAFDQVQSIKGYDKLGDDKKSTVQSFMDNLNWVNMDEGQYNKWLSGFGEVVKMAESGNPKLKQWSESLEVANEKFSATGNVESYNKTLSELAKTISKDLGIDYDTVFAGLESMGKPLSEAERQMNSFLESFGKTRYDLLNGDSIAMQLAEQFQGVSETVDRIFNDQNFQATGKINYDLMTEISNRDDIPDQIQSLASELAKGGVTQAESDLMLEIMMAIKSGDKEKIETAISDVNNKLKEMGLEEHTIDIKTLFDEAGTDKATNKVKDLKKELEGLPKNTKTLIENEVIGEEDIQTLKDLLGESSLPDKKVVQVLLDNQQAITDAGGLKQWLDSIPPETWAKLGIKQENVEEAKQNLDEVKDKQDEIDSKESTIKVNGEETQAAVEDINSLIEHSSKLKDGTYNIDFKTNVGDTVNQLNSVRDAVNDISSAFGNIPNATIKVETAGAAKNISGLMDRVSQYKNATSGIKSITFKSNTAQSAKNITGLITKIRSYNTTASGIKALNFKANTAQAAKNITGLINKVNQFNRLNPKTLVFKAETAQAAKNISGLINKINSVPTGTKTITYKINTVGSPPKPPGEKSAPKPRTLRTMVAPEPLSSPEIMPVNEGIMPIEEPVDTPTPYGWNNPLETHKYGINHFTELENQLKKIASQLSIIDEKAKNAFGKEKIGYLRQQTELLRQQEQVQKKLISDMENQRNSLKGFLSGKGISFDSDGNISNYHDKLIAMNRELERLEKASKNASEASSNYKGENDGERDRLSNASKAAQERLDKYKDGYDELKKALDEYISLTFDGIPKAKEEWEQLNNEIKETQDNLEKLNREQRLFGFKNKVQELDYEFDKVSDKLDIIEQKIKNAYGKDKLDLINQQISLLRSQRDIQNELVGSYKQMANVYREDLSKYGFSFDSNGDFTNLDETLNKFKNHKDLEKVKDLVEEYIKIQRDELPGAILEWEKLNGAIKDAKKEQLEITKKIEDEITKVYKEQVEKRKKLIDEELKKRLDALDKQKDAYNKSRDEADYQKDYDKQQELISKLQEEINTASRDDSLSGKKKLEELLEKLTQEQEKLEEMVQNKIDKNVNDMFDDEKDRLEEEAAKEKEKLDKEFSDEKIKEYVKAALSTGVFEDIDGTMRSLQDVMIDFVDEYGDGMSAIGDLIKNEMIANLEIAKSTMKEISSIIKDLDLKEYSSSIGKMSMPQTSRSMGYSESKSMNNSIQFNSPLIQVEGNVDRDMIPVLEDMIDKAKNDIVDEIVSNIR